METDFHNFILASGVKNYSVKVFSIRYAFGQVDRL